MNQLYHTPREQGPRIVAIGGGHGLSNMLRGLKRYTENLFQNREAILPCFRYKIQCYGYFSYLFTCASGTLYLLYGIFHDTIESSSLQVFPRHTST